MLCIRKRPVLAVDDTMVPPDNNDKTKEKIENLEKRTLVLPFPHILLSFFFFFTNDIRSLTCFPAK